MDSEEKIRDHRSYALTKSTIAFLYVEVEHISREKLSHVENL